MSTHNLLRTELTCTRCGKHGPMEVELFFGLGDLVEYQIGNCVQWVPNKQPQNGGRPDDGNLDGDAYVECPYCGKDFFAIARVQNDRIESVEPDLARKPYTE